MNEDSTAGLNGVRQNGARPAPLAELNGKLAEKCPNCRDLLLTRDLERNLWVCQRCGHHLRLTAQRRIDLLLDPETFEEFAGELRSNDPLHFVSRSQSYKDKLAAEATSTGLSEAVVVGHGTIEGYPLIIVVMDFRFIGGSMGTVVGERITRAIELAGEREIPLLICSASGGARMQEGVLSLMQMAKTSAALAKLAERGVPYFSLLTDPTTGGVSASFAFLGDVILTEPGTLIGFAGPRVIESALHIKLPKDANTAEFVQAHGMLDAIVARRDLRSTFARLLKLYAQARPSGTR
ncbi:MAG TPA: acetyl-CoA carboxylase, carboxyltransferase subunit beta [Ktedonobacterales bacterium]